MAHNINRNIPLIVIFLQFTLLIILITFEVDKRFNTSETSYIIAFCTVLTTIGGVTGVILIYKQLNETKKINEAEFLLRLNTDFITNEKITMIYQKLEMDNCSGEKATGYTIEKSDKIYMTYYMTYFELISYLVDTEVLDIKQVDDLFAYRFFLAAHNKRFQDEELIKDCIYYKDIFRLYDKWIKYRCKNNIETLNYNNKLQDRCEKYYELLKK